MPFNVPTSGYGSRARYDARLCPNCGSEDVRKCTDKAFYKCDRCGAAFTKQAMKRERRVHG